jgi:hypothetical protein
VAVSFGYDMIRWIYAVCVTFAPTALLPPGVVLSIRNIRAVNNPADSLPAIGILAALGAFGGVLNKFPALTTSGSSTCFVVTASAGHQSMEVVILTGWREQFLRPYRMGRLTRCSMRSRNFSRGFVMAPSQIEFWQQLFSPISSTLQSRQQRWGDRKWGELLQQHHVIVRRELRGSVAGR